MMMMMMVMIFFHHLAHASRVYYGTARHMGLCLGILYTIGV